MPYLPEVLDEVKVVVDNYRSTTRLEYPTAQDFADPNHRTIVVIGGNTLSRGLTLEGLVCSFFIRTASAYDTLLQMGRWFGYRPGYEDLPRVWMSDQLKEWFTWLATVEYETRLDIDRYEAEHLTPQEFAVRIRTHPKMAITSALKMRHAVSAEVSYSDQRLQTILFNHRDKDWLAGNLAATRNLIKSGIKQADSVDRSSVGRGRTMLSNVPAATILRFLDEYKFHDSAHDLRSEPLKSYISAQNALGDLLAWNVVVMGLAASRLGRLDLGLMDDVGLINRSRMDVIQPHANIKGLMSKVDRVVDLGISSAELAGKDDQALQAMRPDGIGLLAIYPISKDSTPENRVQGRQPRAPLAAVEHVIGLGMVFPKATKGMTPQTYMSADLSSIEHEEDVVDLDGLDPIEEGEEQSSETKSSEQPPRS
jgi:hypothetical protein